MYVEKCLMPVTKPTEMDEIFHKAKERNIAACAIHTVHSPHICTIFVCKSNSNNFQRMLDREGCKRCKSVIAVPREK